MNEREVQSHAFEIEEKRDKGNFVRTTTEELKNIRSTRVKLCYCLLIFFSLKVILWGLKGTMLNYMVKNYDTKEIMFVGVGVLGSIVNLFFFKINGKIIKVLSCVILVLLLGGFFTFVYPIVEIISNHDLCPHLTTPGFCTQFRAFLGCFAIFDSVGIFCILAILKYSTKFQDVKKKIREDPVIEAKKEEEISKLHTAPFAPLDEDADDNESPEK